MKRIVLACLFLASVAHAGPDRDLYQKAVNAGAEQRCWSNEANEARIIFDMQKISESGSSGATEYDGFGGDRAATYRDTDGTYYVVDHSMGEEICAVHIALD